MVGLSTYVCGLLCVCVLQCMCVGSEKIYVHPINREDEVQWRSEAMYKDVHLTTADRLVFFYTPEFDVALAEDEESYYNCYRDNIVRYGRPSDGIEGSAGFELQFDIPGTYYVVCSIGDNCKKGMRFKAIVKDFEAAPERAPATTPSQGDSVGQTQGYLSAYAQNNAAYEKMVAQVCVAALTNRRFCVYPHNQVKPKWDLFNSYGLYHLRSNDTLVFIYDNHVELVQVGEEGYTNCSFENKVPVGDPFEGKLQDGGKPVVFNKEGMYFFTSSLGKQCENGLKMKVVVNDDFSSEDYPQNELQSSARHTHTHTHTRALAWALVLLAALYVSEYI